VIDGSGFIVQGTGSREGIDLSYRKNITCRNVEIRGFFIGIHLQNSSYIDIVENNIVDNRDGVYLGHSSSVSIIGNYIASNDRYGINLYESRNNIMSENVITTNEHSGIYHFYSGPKPTISNNSIAANVITANQYHDIGIYYSSHNSIQRNTIADNGLRVLFSSSSNHIVYSNSFIDNKDQVHLHESFNNSWISPAASGNYWSNYNPPDEDKDRIGDLPYIIDENNLDQYPLIYPYGFVPSPDVNGDDIITIKDLFQVSRAFGSKPGDVRWNPYADIENDGLINIIDLYQVARNFGKTV